MINASDLANEANTGDVLDSSLYTEISFRNSCCDNFGYVATTLIEYSMHSLECQQFAEPQHNFACLTCKDRTQMVWGIEVFEMCVQVKEAFEIIVHFKEKYS